MSNTTDVELSTIDCHKAITVELAYDDKLPENETVHIQTALLYTTITGERRIRVHNLALPTSVSMPDIFKCCEMDTVINLFAKQGGYFLYFDFCFFICFKVFKITNLFAKEYRLLLVVFFFWGGGEPVVCVYLRYILNPLSINLILKKL